MNCKDLSILACATFLLLAALAGVYILWKDHQDHK